MKFKVITRIKHNGIMYKPGRTVEMDVENEKKLARSVKELISSGVIEEIGKEKQKDDSSEE